MFDCAIIRYILYDDNNNHQQNAIKLLLVRNDVINEYIFK